MVQVAMTDIKNYTNANVATYSTVDRDGTSTNSESSTDPTTLSGALNDVYAKIRKIDTFLQEIHSNITFSTGYSALDFDNTA